jgi:hypothetical protein
MPGIKTVSEPRSIAAMTFDAAQGAVASTKAERAIPSPKARSAFLRVRSGIEADGRSGWTIHVPRATAAGTT